jgi:hypothetical protein
LKQPLVQLAVQGKSELLFSIPDVLLNLFQERLGFLKVSMSYGVRWLLVRRDSRVEGLCLGVFLEQWPELGVERHKDL